MPGFSALSADRCLAILDILVDEPVGLPLTVISKKLNFPASATHRLLSVLMSRGFVNQTENSSYYTATINIAALGLRYLAANNVNEICLPILDGLAQQTGELVRLSILQNDRLIWLLKAQGSQSSIKYDPISGKEVPLHVTAMGKAWLATLDDNRVEEIVTERGFSGNLLGPNALKNFDQLIISLIESRRQGFTLVEEEAEIGISAIAMVIPNSEISNNSIIGCISIGGPSFRLSKQKLISFVPYLKETVREVSRLWPLRTLV